MLCFYLVTPTHSPPIQSLNVCPPKALVIIASAHWGTASQPSAWMTLVSLSFAALWVPCETSWSLPVPNVGGKSGFLKTRMVVLMLLKFTPSYPPFLGLATVQGTEHVNAEASAFSRSGCGAPLLEHHQCTAVPVLKWLTYTMPWHDKAIDLSVLPLISATCVPWGLDRGNLRHIHSDCLQITFFFIYTARCLSFLRGRFTFSPVQVYLHLPVCSEVSVPI